MTTKPLIFSILRQNIFFLALAATAIFLSSCDGEEEPIPAYLEIKPFEMQSTDFGTHGSISSKITNARIFFTDQTDDSIHDFGTVTLPVTVPVTATGLQEITIDPVIKGSGNSFLLGIYPFYERFSQVLDLPPNGDVTVQPTTAYTDDAVFEFIEDFEGASHRFEGDRDNNPNTFIEISSDDVFEGNASGKIRLDTGNVVIVATTLEAFNFNFEQAARVYMELDYKTDVPMEFGVLAINNVGQEIPIFEFIVLEKEEWNKIYFDMTNILVTSGQENFVFVMRAGLPVENGAFTLDEAFIYLDNIKVVHF